MAAAAEAQLDALVDHPLAVQALRHAGLIEQVDGALLEHAGAHAPLDVVARAQLEHDGVDPAQLEQAGEDEPGRPGSDDRDLGLHHASPSNRTAREAGSPGTSSSRHIVASTISATVQPPVRSCAAPSSHGPAAATM